MNIWFVLWLVLSGALLYFTAWTFLILQKQKKAWQVFAKKYKLRFTPGSMMESPTINGLIDGYTVGILVGTHASSDERRARKLSAVEVTLHGTLPAEGVLASADMVAIAQDINLKTEVKPDHPDWKDEYIATTSKKPVIDKYLTRERLDHLTGLMKIKSAAVILIFREDIMLLRFDTPDPLDTPQKLDKLVKKVIEAAKVLEPEEALPKEKRVKKQDEEPEEAQGEKDDDAQE